MGGARVTTLVTLRKCTLGHKREIKTLKFVSASTKGFKGGLSLDQALQERHGSDFFLLPTLKTKNKKKRHESIRSLRGDSGTWGRGMRLHDKRTQRTHNQWRRTIFFCPQIYHLGPWWGQEANGCHHCIRKEFSKWVGQYSRNPPTQRYVKNMAKTQFSP